MSDNKEQVGAGTWNLVEKFFHDDKPTIFPMGIVKVNGIKMGGRNFCASVSSRSLTSKWTTSTISERPSHPGNAAACFRKKIVAMWFFPSMRFDRFPMIAV